MRGLIVRGLGLREWGLDLLRPALRLEPEEAHHHVVERPRLLVAVVLPSRRDQVLACFKVWGLWLRVLALGRRVEG